MGDVAVGIEQSEAHGGMNVAAHGGAPGTPANPTRLPLIDVAIAGLLRAAAKNEGTPLPKPPWT